MAAIDDMNRLAAMDVVYLRRTFGGSTEVFRGRLRQSLTGSWVFNSSTGQNGAVGFILGGVGQNWTSTDYPSGGITIQIPFPIFQSPNVGSVTEYVILTSVIPAEFTE
jgi:hypothetical protein